MFQEQEPGNLQLLLTKTIKTVFGNWNNAKKNLDEKPVFSFFF